MKRVLLVALVAFAAGCSNAPIAGLMDCFPARDGRQPAPERPSPPPENRPDAIPPAAPIVPPVGPPGR